MGGHSRYKVSMFDHQWRVVLHGARDELVAGFDKFPEADAAYKLAVKDNPDRIVMLMQRTRIVKRSDIRARR